MPSLHRLLLRHRRGFSSSADPVPYGNINAAAAGTFKWVRDRGLDHAVERERNLLPLINIKNRIAAAPSKCLPLSSSPLFPVSLLRRYPTVFREFLSSDSKPHFGLTDEALDLHSDEALMYSGESYRNDVADRLVKLLMLSRAHRMPLPLLHSLRWDLGLPADFETSLVPDFPDYFRLAGANNSRHLELVCWIKDLAVSAMEKSGNSGTFPVKYSRGFVKDQTFEKWVEDWQKLPYFSPYENIFGQLPSSGAEFERWAVAVLHEFLHILVPKKTSKENVLGLGEWLNLQAKFKRALLHHPGIFYLSSKNHCYTLVLKDGFRRGACVESHPLMDMRSKYIHLMNIPLKKESDKKKNSMKVIAQSTSGESSETVGEDKDEKIDGESVDSSEDEKIDRESVDSSEDESLEVFGNNGVARKYVRRDYRKSKVWSRAEVKSQPKKKRIARLLSSRLKTEKKVPDVMNMPWRSKSDSKERSKRSSVGTKKALS